MNRIYLVCYYIILNIGIYTSTTYGVCSDYIDTRSILESWPQETVSWLKKHEVPSDLKAAIESCLLHNDILDCLSSIYTYYALSQEQFSLLQEKGFRFLGGKLTIFEIRQIPGYVFKIAKPHGGRSELFNVARIAQAQVLRKSARRWGLQKSIIIPKKYAFIMPKKSTVNYENLPKIIVVSQKIDIRRSPKEFRHLLAKMWLRLQGMKDLRKSNVYHTHAGLALIDTEPWKSTVLVPGFYKKKHICLTDKGFVIRRTKTA